MIEQIIDSGGSKFMGDILELKGDLPDNCRLNKVITGCGGTTVALSNSVNYVIAVPFTEMIRDKCKSHSSVQGVYASITDDELVEYKSKRGNKWMCTYNSLERVLRYIDPSEYKLLVDESHKLVDSGSFRATAIRSVLNNFKSFRSYVFMSATPIPDRLEYEELVNVRKVKIDWGDLSEVSINYTSLEAGKKGLVSMMVSKIALEHRVGLRSGNAHVFLNSVKMICEIVSNLISRGVGFDEINIVTSRTYKNEVLLKKHGEGAEIGSVRTPNKLNFYTSTAFEGSDILDKNGVVYVATDGSKNNTKINILTTLPQIVGRIRNLSPENRNRVNLIFTPTRHCNFSSEEEFIESTSAERERASELLSAYNKEKNAIVKEAIAKGANGVRYLFVDGFGKLSLNEQLIKSEIFNYITIHSTYYIRGSQSISEGKTNNNNTIYAYSKNPESVEFTLEDKLLVGKQVKFAEVCKTYISTRELVLELRSKGIGISSNERKTLNDSVVSINMIEAEYEDNRSCYEELGVERMYTLQYSRQKMKMEVIAKSREISDRVKISKMLGYGVGGFKSSREIKKDLTKYYLQIGSLRVAKATDILDWYDVSPKYIWNKESRKMEKGVIIHRKRMVHEIGELE